MRTRQTIAIFGAAGNLGSGLATNLSKGNYHLLLFAQKPDEVSALVAEIKKKDPMADVEEQDCAVDAGWEADIIMMAVPHAAQKTIAERIREVANQKIVICLDNKARKTSVSSAGEDMQALLPGSVVVKARTVTDATATAVIIGKRDATVGSDDSEAIQSVAEVLHAAGFTRVIAEDPATNSLQERKPRLPASKLRVAKEQAAGFQTQNH